MHQTPWESEALNTFQRHPRCVAGQSVLSPGVVRRKIFDFCVVGRFGAAAEVEEELKSADLA